MIIGYDFLLYENIVLIIHPLLPIYFYFFIFYFLFFIFYFLYYTSWSLLFIILIIHSCVLKPKKLFEYVYNFYPPIFFEYEYEYNFYAPIFLSMSMSTTST